MRKGILYAILLLNAWACVNMETSLPDNVERIPVDVHAKESDVTSFIEKIEIIPLETTDSSLFHKCTKSIYDKEMNLFTIYTRQQDVFTFTGEGKFIGSSMKYKGGGPDEYSTAIDIGMNPYLKGIDLLSPYGTVYTYTPTFELISRRTIEAEFVLTHFLPLDSCNYVFTYPSLLTNQEITFADVSTGKTFNTNYEGTISAGNGLDKTCFYKLGEHSYFVPKGVNYYFYRLDTLEKKCIPIMYLDFGDEKINESALPGRAVGKRITSESEIVDIEREYRERHQFLRTSDYYFPTSKFFNDKYVYLFIRGGNDACYHYIYNRERQTVYLHKYNALRGMPICFCLADDSLLAICEPMRLSQSVYRELMSPIEIEKLKQIKDDDNPVIIKYYLK